MRKIFEVVSVIVLSFFVSMNLYATEGCREDCGSKYELCEEIQGHFSGVFVIQNGAVETFPLAEVENEDDCSVELEFIDSVSGNEIELIIEHYDEINGSGFGHWFIDEVKAGDFNIDFDWNHYAGFGLRNSYDHSDDFQGWGLIKTTKN